MFRNDKMILVKIKLNYCLINKIFGISFVSYDMNS